MLWLFQSRRLNSTRSVAVLGKVRHGHLEYIKCYSMSRGRPTVHFSAFFSDKLMLPAYSSRDPAENANLPWHRAAACVMELQLHRLRLWHALIPRSKGQNSRSPLRPHYMTPTSSRAWSRGCRRVGRPSRSACHRNNFWKSCVLDVSARILARMLVS